MNVLLFKKGSSYKIALSLGRHILQFVFIYSYVYDALMYVYGYMPSMVCMWGSRGPLMIICSLCHVGCGGIELR